MQTETPRERAVLCDDTSRWGTELYIATHPALRAGAQDVTRPVPGARMATISGRFRTRVYDGPFRDVPRWIDDLRGHLVAKGLSMRKVYVAYTTCPRCAKAYGHNYVVLFAQVGEAA